MQEESALNGGGKKSIAMRGKSMTGEDLQKIKVLSGGSTY